MKYLYPLLSHNSIRYIRNLFNYRPTISYKPKTPDSTISDFFFWQADENLDTKFFLTNLASQILPEKKQNDLCDLFIYNQLGSLVKEIQINLNFFETKEIKFSDLNLKGFGSFFAFHKFENKIEILNNQTFVAERGYISYSDNGEFWKFVHGNNYAAYKNTRTNKIESLLTNNFKKYKYTPQLSFKDCRSFEVILNNPLNKNFSFQIETMNNEKKTYQYKLPAKGTKKIQFNNTNYEYITIISNFIMLRPIIIKNYINSFDILHG